jgi:hypothetical protein
MIGAVGLVLWFLIPLGVVLGEVWRSKGGNFWLLFLVGVVAPVVGVLIVLLGSPRAERAATEPSAG